VKGINTTIHTRLEKLPEVSDSNFFQSRLLFAISAQTPIYRAVKGHKVGDSFVINGQSQTIKEIF
jgi:uncharacterized membrane protein YoaK (UPF0700 family)